MQVKIPKWITKLIPKNLLPPQGEISIGMINFEATSSKSSVVETDEVTPVFRTGFAEVSATFSNTATTSGDGSAPHTGGSSRAVLLAAPYGLNEFYGYQYNSCLLVGTKVLMYDGTEKNIEDLEIDDELYSPILPGLQSSYHNYILNSLENLQFAKGKVKRVVFDFILEYYSINKKYNATQNHAIFAQKDKDKKFEWWQMKDLQLGDKLVNTKLELEEVTTIEKIEMELEVVSIGLRKYNVFFANGYMNHD